MSREEAKQNLVALGIEEPTDAQVTNYLNQFHANAPKPEQKPDLLLHPDQKPDAGAGNAELDEAMRQIAQLKADIVQRDIAAYAAEKGLTGEQSAGILGGLTADLDVAKKAIDSFASFVAAKETAAAIKKEQEIANGSTPPAGSGGDGGDPDGGELSTGAKMAQAVNARYVIE